MTCKKEGLYFIVVHHTTSVSDLVTHFALSRFQSQIKTQKVLPFYVLLSHSRCFKMLIYFFPRN